MYLKLDPSIRNWVLFPITIITIAVNLLMKYLHMVFNQGQTKPGQQSTSKRGTDEFEIRGELSHRDSELKIK